MTSGIEADATSADRLTPFVLEHAAVRGAFASLPATAREVLALHDYPPAVARVMGELLAACALLASTLKFEGSLIAQLSGDGPVRLLVVECTDALGLRATAQWDAARVERLGPGATLADLAGGGQHGRLVLTLDQKGTGTMYQGIVALEAGSIAGLIEHYLATSEQLASRLLLATGDGGAAGLLVQRLPGASDDDDSTWRRIEGIVDAADAAVLLSAHSTHDAIASVFREDDVRVFKARPVAFACSCSRERVARALRIAGAAEIESILAERGEVEVTCEFCNRRYTFAPSEARALF